MSRCIRTWGKYFLLNGELPADRQGKHTKIERLLDSEDFVNVKNGYGSKSQNSVFLKN